jgi:hypothetical protein
MLFEDPATESYSDDHHGSYAGEYPETPLKKTAYSTRFSENSDKI